MGYIVFVHEAPPFEAGYGTFLDGSAYKPWFYLPLSLYVQAKTPSLCLQQPQWRAGAIGFYWCLWAFVVG